MSTSDCAPAPSQNPSRLHDAAVAGRTIARRTAKLCRDLGGRCLDGAMTPTPHIGTPSASILFAGPRETFEVHRGLLAALGAPSWLGEDYGRAAAYDMALLDLFWTAESAVQLLLRNTSARPISLHEEATRTGRSDRLGVPGAGACNVVARMGEFARARTAEHVVGHRIGLVGFDRLALHTLELLENAAANGQQFGVFRPPGLAIVLHSTALSGPSSFDDISEQHALTRRQPAAGQPGGTPACEAPQMNTASRAGVSPGFYHRWRVPFWTQVSPGCSVTFAPSSSPSTSEPSTTPKTIVSVVCMPGSDGSKYPTALAGSVATNSPVALVPRGGAEQAQLSDFGASSW